MCIVRRAFFSLNRTIFALKRTVLDKNRTVFHGLIKFLTRPPKALMDPFDNDDDVALETAIDNCLIQPSVLHLLRQSP